MSSTASSANINSKDSLYGLAVGTRFLTGTVEDLKEFVKENGGSGKGLTDESLSTLSGYPIFSSESIYVEGSVVVKDQKLYSCKSLTVGPGEWTGTADWNQTSFEELDKCGISFEDLATLDTTDLDDIAVETSVVGRLMQIPPATALKANEEEGIYDLDKGAANPWNEKQDRLVSGTNIKTINNISVLGNGNISISNGGLYPMVQVSDGILKDHAVNVITGSSGMSLQAPARTTEGDVTYARDFIVRIEVGDTVPTYQWMFSAEVRKGGSWDGMKQLTANTKYIYRFSDLGGSNLTSTREEID